MVRSHPLELIDTRFALRTYATVVGLAGFILAAWGQIWLGSHLAELPWGRAVLIRLCGAVMIGAAVCAMGLATAGVLTRRRLLSWFIGAHAVVWLMLEGQVTATIGPIGPARPASWAMLAVILGLLYIRFASDPTARAPLPLVDASGSPRAPDAGDRLEQKIRETAAQEERNRLARDLHDAVKQQIFAIQTSAATAEARFEADPGGARKAVGQVRQSAREAMAEMEAMLEQLRVVPLGNTGLVEAIRKQCEALAFRTGAEVDVRVGGLPRDEVFEPGTHTAIFRVVQEALANVGRHARARHVLVTLSATPARRLEVRIQDDGVGFDQTGAAAGMGTQNMRARAAELGGSIEVGRGDGAGTIVTLSVPFDTSDARDARRRHALGLAVLSGFLSALALRSLFDDGPGLANVFVVFFLLAFAHHLRSWFVLRRASRTRGAVAADSVP